MNSCVHSVLSGQDLTRKAGASQSGKGPAAAQSFLSRSPIFGGGSPFVDWPATPALAAAPQVSVSALCSDQMPSLTASTENLIRHDVKCPNASGIVQLCCAAWICFADGSAW